jgi:hypothetical protein
MGKTSIATKLVTAAFAGLAIIIMTACGGGNSSEPGGCGQPVGGCTGGETAAKLQSGCCETAACGAGGTATYATCADSCSNVWYEYNGKEYGPCASGNESCVTNAASEVVSACGT